MRTQILNSTLYTGDCIEVLADIETASVATVIADPPYMIGFSSVGNPKNKSGTWADIENAAHWFAAWMRESKRVLQSDGYLFSFCNWRSLPAIQRAAVLSGLPATSCIVWDKMWIGPGSAWALRPRYELIFVSAMPGALIPDRSQPDIISEKWQAGNMKTTEHPAEKPVGLIKKLLQLQASKGVVLDPFMGSGTTGVACAELGREFIGIEREARYFNIARSRIEQASTAKRAVLAHNEAWQMNCQR